MFRTSRSMPTTASVFVPATSSLLRRAILSLDDARRSIPRVALGKRSQPGVVGVEGIVLVGPVEPAVGAHGLPVVGAGPLHEQGSDDDQPDQVARRPEQAASDVLVLQE